MLFVVLGAIHGVDPRLGVAIAGVESSMGKAPSVNGGVYNTFGNSDHFTHDPKTNAPIHPKKPVPDNYIAPIHEFFELAGKYMQENLTNIVSFYNTYEGRSAGDSVFFDRVKTMALDYLQPLGAGDSGLNKWCKK